jgi:ankyrin repeat protein
MRRPLPTRQLPERPDLDQLKRQAKELRDRFEAGATDAVAEVHAHYRDANRAWSPGTPQRRSSRSPGTPQGRSSRFPGTPQRRSSTFALHDAQLVLARAYGFDSWPKLKAFVDGVTVRRLRDAVVADDRAQVRAMLKVRPELGHASLDNLQILHYAVFNRSAEMVRLLMRHGAPARHGVYPHRDATSALTIAMERGYDDIVAVIQEEERHQREEKTGVSGAPAPDELFKAIAAGDDARAIGLMDRDPALVRTCHPEMGLTPLHIAARRLNPRLVEWLLDRGADSLARDVRDHVALDWAAYSSEADTADRFHAIAKLLLARGGVLTAPAAVVLGDIEWLRARHADGSLTNPIEDAGGLLRIAASHNRADVLELLLDYGFDPDERIRFGDGDEHAFSWGMPLAHCARTGKYELAEMILKHGADPNASIYASGDPVFWAFGEGDRKMVKLLEQYGGVPTAGTAASFRQTELARKMLAGEAPSRVERNATLAEELLWGAACGGDPEIVRMALERVDWPRDDPRWFEMLEQPLRFWAHGSAGAGWDRTTYLDCFRLLLPRCDPNMRGRPTDQRQFGLTILHSIAGSREHLTPDDRLGFATAALDAGARLDVRDNLLKSTPLGWACRWGRKELVKLFLERGADPVEADAEPWATPDAWAEKMAHANVGVLLKSFGK